MKPSLLGMRPEELREVMTEAGFEAYRADQLADWVYKKSITDIAEMSNIPQKLTERFAILTSHVVCRSDSSDGCTKLLLGLHDGPKVETVLIPTQRRATACVSSQAGCAMGCAFCASGLEGLERNLTCGEILEQILHLQHLGRRFVTNVVFMGTGEPLANYDETLAAVRAIIDPQRFGISARRITVSTVGLPAQIRRLVREDLPITLAISLHAPDDKLRQQLIPGASKYCLREILDAAEEFHTSRNREITLEYVLLAGVNDSAPCAEGLAEIAGRLRCNVNLIYYNPVVSLPYKRPSQVGMRSFAERLSRRGINVNIRRSRGLDAHAACGQLRYDKSANKE